MCKVYVGNTLYTSVSGKKKYDAMRSAIWIWDPFQTYLARILR